MLPRPLILAGCFIMAMFAGWAARETKAPATAGNDASPDASSPASSGFTMPEGMDDLATRFWLAEHLTEATSDQLKLIASRLKDTDPLRRAWRGVLSCWLEKDATAAWAFASPRNDLRMTALEEWAKLDPAAARAALTAPSADDLAALVRGAMEKDLNAGFRLLEEALAAGDAGKGDEVSERFGLSDRYFAELASVDPLAAAAWVQRLGLERMEGALLWGRWKKDPAALREWLGQQQRSDLLLDDLVSFAADERYQPALLDFLAGAYPVGSGRYQMMNRLWAELARKDPEFAAKEAARAIPDPAMRADAIAAIAKIVAETDTAKAWALLETLGSPTQGVRRRTLPKIELRAGSESDALPPPVEYQISLSLQIGSGSPAELSARLLKDLMTTDKDRAVQLMDRIPPQEFVPAGADAFELWVERDYEAAVRWLAAKLGDQGDLKRIERLVDDGADPPQQAALLRTLPEGKVRAALATRLAGMIAEEDPVAALEFARKATTSDEAVARVYASWSSGDPAAAMKHLTHDADAPAAAQESVAAAAVQSDPEHAEATIGALPDGPARDAAISSLLESMDDADPLKAGDWALALGDAGKRKAAMEKLFGSISLDLRLIHDPTAAEAMRQQVKDAANLTETERQQWLKRIDLEFSQP